MYRQPRIHNALHQVLLAATVWLLAAIPALADPAVLNIWPAAAQPKPPAPSAILRSGDDEAARIWLFHDEKNLYLRFDVIDASPLQNSGTEYKTLFKTGDSVDLQLGLNPDAVPTRTQPVEGDIRLLMTRTKAGPIAVLYRYKAAGTETPERFSSPTGTLLVDRVEKLKDALITTSVIPRGYRLEATIPWSTLAGRPYVPTPDKPLRGDVGVLFSDPDGQVTVERIYWSNKDTNIVADVPSELRLHPDLWGDVRLFVK